MAFNRTRLVLRGVLMTWTISRYRLTILIDPGACGGSGTNKIGSASPKQSLPVVRLAPLVLADAESCLGRRELIPVRQGKRIRDHAGQGALRAGLRLFKRTRRP